MLALQLREWRKIRGGSNIRNTSTHCINSPRFREGHAGGAPSIHLTLPAHSAPPTDCKPPAPARRADSRTLLGSPQSDPNSHESVPQRTSAAKRSLNPMDCARARERLWRCSFQKRQTSSSKKRLPRRLWVLRNCLACTRELAAPAPAPPLRAASSGGVACGAPNQESRPCPPLLALKSETVHSGSARQALLAAAAAPAPASADPAPPSERRASARGAPGRAFLELAAHCPGTRSRATAGTGAPAARHLREQRRALQLLAPKKVQREAFS